jgi:hypothetical protein
MVAKPALMLMVLSLWNGDKLMKIFTAWLWQAMYDYIKVEANSQEEADAIADAWVLAGYPKGDTLKEMFPTIKEIS